MPFIYSSAVALKDKPKVGTHECVALVQHYTKAGSTKTWVAGERVIGNLTIRIGTAIATFRNGKYASDEKNNHAAFFLRHGPNGSIVVVDQWKDRPGREPRNISVRTIERRGGPHSNGSWPFESDNADAFFVIERGVPPSVQAYPVKKAVK